MLFAVLICQSAGAAEEAEIDPPSAELLEFLGEWETEDGKWHDPVEFMESFKIFGRDKTEGDDHE